MLRLRFHASWLPDEHKQFWIIIDCTKNIETINDLIEYFNEQQKSLSDYYQFHIPKRSTKLKYLKAFVNDCILPPNAYVNQILRDNDQVDFCLEIDAQDQWLLVKPPPTFKRKRLSEQEILPPSPPPPPASLDNLDQLLETIAQPANSSEKTPFVFQFGNKRGRPIPPRPPVISSVKVNSLVPRQVLKTKK